MPCLPQSLAWYLLYIPPCCSSVSPTPSQTYGPARHRILRRHRMLCPLSTACAQTATRATLHCCFLCECACPSSPSPSLNPPLPHLAPERLPPQDFRRLSSRACKSSSSPPPPPPTSPPPSACATAGAAWGFSWTRAPCAGADASCKEQGQTRGWARLLPYVLARSRKRCANKNLQPVYARSLPRSCSQCRSRPAPGLLGCPSPPPRPRPAEQREGRCGPAGAFACHRRAAKGRCPELVPELVPTTPASTPPGPGGI